MTANHSNMAQLPEQNLSPMPDLGLVTANGFEPVWTSNTPYEVSALQWRVANITARALATLFAAVSRDSDVLRRVLQNRAPSSLASQLLARLPEYPRLENEVLIMRHDLMLDHHSNWRLIETNSIAAGMGPFSERLASSLSTEFHHNFVPNDASFLQAEALYRAACERAENSSPAIVFVVAEQEDNVIDQHLLAAAVREQGARVFFRTFAQLQRERMDTSQLWLRDIGLIDLLYFRTGYNLDDYRDESGQVERWLDLRAELDTLDVRVCPGISGQLASHKGVQRYLSSLSANEMTVQFGLSDQQAIFARLALSTAYQDVDPATLAEDLNSGHWLLKSSGEGGGNVFDSLPTPAQFSLLSDPLLMQRIRPRLRAEPVTLLRGKEQRTIGDAVSELGVFTVGANHSYGGYLLRTKSASALECGVHKGFGAIDTVVVTQR
ncbi:hypothetical protein [Reinekea sp. G2M2-21]|uniref:hypothetical protein n=1 Tax=Reinekea sp. G2M2-21 TaxID=2788942 RepID=UPI0018A945B4|nr:hypothetical protein [Reinekea sp. G2M2-21]